MKNPFFSVVIPTFNQAAYLKVALDSVFKQTFKNFEVIVIDNYSTDDTKKIIKNFKKKIIYRKIHNNGVIAKSRNIGIKKAKGEWIAFLDSDDYWSVDKLSKIHNNIKKKNFDVICNSEWILNFKKKTKLWTYGPNSKNLYEKILKYGNRNSTSASIVKKSFLDKHKIFFNEKNSFITCEDYCFFLDIAYLKGKFFYLNEPLGTHRFHNKSYSYNKIKHTKAEYEVIKYHIFNKQKFNINKNKLFKIVKNNILIKKIIFELMIFLNMKKNLAIFFNISTSKPIETLRIIFSLFKKAFKQNVIYFSYISKKNL